MGSGSPHFQTTLWSDVLLIGSAPDSEAGQKALAALCERYWYPVYAFIRRRGASVEDAEDLAQAFFAHILTSRFFERADPEMGRFRNFLLGALRNFLSHDAERRNSQRSGGRREKLPIDSGLAEHWLCAEATVHNDPVAAFNLSWASAVMNHALGRLEQEQVDSGRQHVFVALKDFLQRSPATGEYESVARSLRMSKGAVAAATHRLNRRYGEIVRLTVRETVSTAEMAEHELSVLLSTLGK